MITKFRSGAIKEESVNVGSICQVRSIIRRRKKKTLWKYVIDSSDVVVDGNGFGSVLVMIMRE